MTTQDPPPDRPPEPDRIAWERPGPPGIPALFETLKEFILAPAAAYTRVPTTGDFMRPLSFFALLVTLGTFLDFVYSSAFGDVMLGIPEVARRMEIENWAWDRTTGLLNVVLAPLVAAVASFVVTAVLHVMVVLLGANRYGFFATYRAVCYAGTAYVAQLIPACGSVVAGLWATVLTVVGIAETQRCGYGRSTVAVLIPLFLVCCCTGLFMMFVVGLVAAVEG